MTLRNWLSFWCGLLVVLLSGYAVTQEYEKVCDAENPDLCSQPLQAGEVAPFSGQLITTELAITLGQKAEYCDTRIRLETEFIASQFQLDLDLERRLHQIDNEGCVEKVDLLNQRLKERQERKWYRHPLFVSTVSVILTGVVIYSSIQLSGQVVN
jgi:hypothetical protein